MKILVTGGKGGIGTRLVAQLAAHGHTPVSYDIVDGQDLFDTEKLEAAIQDADIVYHVAAEANLNNMRTFEGARDGMRRNVQATENVAYLSAKHKKWMLYISTMCVYGDVEVHPEREDTTLPNPSEIYACSKYAAEWIVRGYGINFGLPYTILRIATVYGPNCRPELGVHVFFNQALAGEDITVHGDGSQRRTLTYVDDVVDGLVAAVEHPDAAQGQIFNITGNEQVSAISMAEQIKELTGSSSSIVFIPQRAHNTQDEDPDVSKAEKLLGWKAGTLFSDGLKKTLAWLKEQGG
jgi:nucleoside-diphosphate-sugar epimerase